MEKPLVISYAKCHVSFILYHGFIIAEKRILWVSFSVHKYINDFQRKVGKLCSLQPNAQGNNDLMLPNLAAYEHTIYYAYGHL